MTCYISLLLYRLLEKKLGNIYTTEQILEILRSMQVTLLSKASGYIPSYTRTELTDALHKTFGFRTDYEFITKTTKNTVPAAIAMSAKTVFLVRLQGLEPWTP